MARRGVSTARRGASTASRELTETLALSGKVLGSTVTLKQRGVTASCKVPRVSRGLTIVHLRLVTYWAYGSPWLLHGEL